MENKIQTWQYVVAALSLAFLVFLFWGGYVRKEQVYSEKNTVNSVLEEQSATFRQAQVLSKERDYSAALELYAQALEEAQDSAQQSQIRYKIAAMTDLSGNRMGAIDMYKDIATDVSVRPRVRAYAVLMLGRMYILAPDERVHAAIFEGAPFAQMADGVERERAYKNLFEYGSSIAPIALTETYVARWYASELARAKRGEIELSDEQKEDYKRKVDQKLALARIDGARMAADPNENTFVPPAKAAGAQALGFLHLAGEGEEKAAHDSFAGAFNLSAVYNKPGDDGLVRMRYAFFLTELGGSENMKKAEEILVSMYNSAYRNSVPTRYLEFLPLSAPHVAEYKDVVRLAKKISSFQDFLMSLGWNESVFK